MEIPSTRFETGTRTKLYIVYLQVDLSTNVEIKHS